MTPKPLPPLAEVFRARAQSLRVSQARCASEVPGPRGEAQAMAYGFEAEEIRTSLLPLAQDYDAELARLRAENLELRRVGAVLYEFLRWNDPGPEADRKAAREAWERIQEAAP